ncbi:helix-turn-helix transcriptional regulator [Variovorax sp. ZT4R33]|uniref:helix-turn-helix transcriptional regulator n=1 Tax=Variovorax sp. ZT4R33 TaxID=3443743 RepID=UPI003F453C16
MNKALGDSVHAVRDVATFDNWLGGPLAAALPHQALLCGQYIPHSGGYTAIERRSVGLQTDYLKRISCGGLNVRSPILSRLMRSGGPEFFDAERHASTIDPAWLAELRSFGWRNILAMACSDGAGDDVLLTAAGFYNVAPEAEYSAAVLQEIVMPQLHAAFKAMRQTDFGNTPHEASPAIRLAPVEEAIVALLRQGKTNKEIGRQLGKSDETVKHRLANLIRRLKVKNRTELVDLISRAQVVQARLP